MSKLRKIYFVRLIMRCMVFVLCVLMWFRKSAQLKVLKGMAFFENLTALHLLWFIWMMDMLCQLLPIKAQISLGSQKLFKCRFKPVGGNFDRTALKKYIVSTTKSAYLVSIPSAYGEQVLYDLQDIQLGSSDDVHTDDIRGRILREESAVDVDFGMAGMGTVRVFSSGAVLGEVQ